MWWNQITWFKHQLHSLLALWSSISLFNLPVSQFSHLKNGFNDNSLIEWPSGLNNIIDINYLAIIWHIVNHQKQLFSFLNWEYSGKHRALCRGTIYLSPGNDMAHDYCPALCLLWIEHSCVGLDSFHSPLLWAYIRQLTNIWCFRGIPERVLNSWNYVSFSGVTSLLSLPRDRAWDEVYSLGLLPPNLLTLVSFPWRFWSRGGLCLDKQLLVWLLQQQTSLVVSLSVGC